MNANKLRLIGYSGKDGAAEVTRGACGEVALINAHGRKIGGSLRVSASEKSEWGQYAKVKREAQREADAAFWEALSRGVTR